MRAAKTSRMTFVFIALFLLSLLLTVVIGEAAELKLRVKVPNANIRLKPATESMIILQAPVGAILKSVGTVGEWYKIDLPPDKDGVVVTGYIHQTMVEVMEEAPQAPEVVQPPQVREQPIQRTPPPVTQQPVITRELPRETSNRGLTGVGLKGGITMANLYGEDVEDYGSYEDIETKMGFCFGAFFTYNFTEMFAIQPEVLFTMKGAKSDGTIPFFGWKYSYKVNLNYIEVPILFKICFPTQSTIKPNIFVGPYAAIKQSFKYKTVVDDISTEGDIEHMKSTDFGVVFGAGIDFALNFLGRGKLTIDGRYSLGLTTISDEEYTAGTKVDVKNKVIAFLLGYSF